MKKMKSLNFDRILRQIVPSVFFILLFSFFAFVPEGLTMNIVAGIFALLLLGNIFLQNKIVNRILGIVFLLGSVFFIIAINDNVFDRGFTFANKESALGYFVWLFLLLISFVMSALLIWGYNKEQLKEIEVS